MMRRLRTSAACPHVAARTRITGFTLFTQETQKQQKVLRSRTLTEGQKNMQVMSELWAELTPHRRQLYNVRGRQRNAMKINDPIKKNNNFNLLMKLFGAEKLLMHAGDRSFTALMAKSTMQAMRPKDTRRLRAKLKADEGMKSTKSRKPCSHTSAFKRFANPHMMFFDSFTEMQRSVAPTRHAAFTAVSKMVSLCNVSEAGEMSTIQNFASLTPAETNLFAPISDEEAPFFEVFCATRCGSLDYTHFNILQLFTAFRGIDVETATDPARELVYRSLLGSDRSHDGAYFRARRCLERLETLRSSDCSLFLAKRNAAASTAKATVPPNTYGIEPAWDEVAVAALLAETRHAQSVYDDVLTRAAVLRSEANNARLKMYEVRLEDVAASMQVKKAVVQRRAAVEETEVEELTARQAGEEAEAEEEEVKAAASTVAAEREVEDQVEMVATRSTVRVAKAEKATASRQASVEARSRSASPAKASSRVAAATSSRKSKKAQTAVKAAAKSRALKAVTPRRTTADVMEDDTELEDDAADVDVAKVRATTAAAAPKKKKKQVSSKAKATVAPATPVATPADAITAETEDGFGAEEFLASEDEAAVEEGDDVQAALSDTVDDDEEAADELEMTERDAAAAGASVARGKVAASGKRRTARSQLTDPSAMLPAKARVNKLITKHSSSRKKAQQPQHPVTKPQPSPYQPPHRNADFTSSIRALLSGSL